MSFMAITACTSGGPPAATGADTRNLGATAYATNCAACHGTKGEGEANWKSRRPDGTLPAPPHDSAGHTWHHNDADLLAIIRRGGQAVYGGPDFTSRMPGWGDRLSNDEIQAVLDYIKTFWGPAERKYQSSLPTR